MIRYIREYLLYRSIRKDMRDSNLLNNISKKDGYEKFMVARLLLSNNIPMRVLYNKNTLYIELLLSNIEELYKLKRLIIEEKIYKCFFLENIVIRLILETIDKKEMEMRK